MGLVDGQIVTEDRRRKSFANGMVPQIVGTRLLSWLHEGL
jgi:hypothetical protein